MASTSDVEKRYELITRSLAEVLGGDSIKALLEQGKTPSCYWGTAPTGRPHIGYFVPLVKIADFLRAGVEVKILLADIHAFLDNLKAPLELVSYRTKFYEKVLRAVFTSLGIPTQRLLFFTGQDYQLSKEYAMDIYKLCSICSERDAKKAGAEVVKQVENPLLSGLLYPGLQALDEQYLGVDFQFGGVDQRKIFTFAELYLPRLGYAKRAHMMNAMVPGLKGAKMSSSEPDSKIDFLDPPNVIEKKIKSAVCAPRDITENGLLAFVKAVLIPISELRLERLRGEATEAAGTALEPAANGAAIDTELPKPFIGEGAPEGTVFTVTGDPARGGKVFHFKTYEELEAAYAEDIVGPQELKYTVKTALIGVLAPIQAAFEADEEWRKIADLAYPQPTKPEPKKKKEKVYHPPPPGKGKNAKQPAPDGVAEAAPAEAAAEPPAAS
ncbi:tyrosine tRNA ligase [Coniophora puteana RWD-64-598 SS2]|uniref:Tyrosine--tRNA ligase n=1 Tax=Coniophora puteana (strain RWD-64-598) TaxID=741705 RepID=A0A5M3MF91_CONPW|nr:tyrosine tRNA ligase [Coniophora puteana RWD-64-598 SS2]EIW77872.1 tyrosine tRNA ligase [Coniophora puteana RWD-64-598 SS2]